MLTTHVDDAAETGAPYLVLDDGSVTEPMALAETIGSSGQLRVGEATRERVGRYRVLRVLGEGGMGIVYAAYDDELTRPVALKLIRGSSASALARERMRREAQAMAQLSHPNVVQIYDVGDDEGELFLTMELVHGQDLDTWLAELGRGQARARRWREIVEVFVAAGRGLAAAHAAGLIHRDFKPSNVLVGAQVVKVGDFGLAQASAEAVEAREDRDPGSGELAERMTQTGALVGTPAYLAPEQLSGREASVASDQFSFCVALWEALTGARPFAGEDLASLAANLLAGRRQPPPEGVSLPRWLLTVLERGLALDPSERWPNMEALLGALLDDPATRRRRRVALGVGALAVIGVGATLGFVQLQRDRECRERGAALYAVWNDEARAELAGTFAQASPSTGVATWALVEPRLDAWVREWADASRAACHAAFDEPARAQPQAACLEHERWELEALLETFREIDRAGVFEAVSASAELPEVARCQQPAWLTSEVSLAGSEDGSLRRDLAQVYALGQAGRLPQALELAERSLESARALGDTLLEAEALAKLGGIRWRMEAFAEAERDLLAGHLLAAHVGLDRVTYATARDLAWVVGVRLSRSAEGRVWLELARASVARTGGDPDADAELFERLGELEMAEGKLQEALATHERALALREQQLGSGHPALAESLLAIGWLECALGEDQGLATLERAREAAVAVLGPDHPTVSTIDSQRGHALFERGELDESVVALRRALASRERVLGPEDPSLALVLGNLGTVLGQRGETLESLLLLERAAEILKNSMGSEHPEALWARLSLADAQAEAGQLDTAIASMRALLPVMERVMGAQSQETMAAHSYLAHYLTKAGAHAEALPSLRRVVALDQAQLGADHPEVADDLDALSRSELGAGELEAALASAERSLAIREQTLEPGDPQRAAAQVRVALALLALGRDAQALELHARALEQLPPEAKRGELPADEAALRAELAELRGEPAG